MQINPNLMGRLITRILLSGLILGVMVIPYLFPRGRLSRESGILIALGAGIFAFIFLTSIDWPRHK